jgi:hypothetical protein
MLIIFARTRTDNIRHCTTVVLFAVLWVRKQTTIARGTHLKHEKKTKIRRRKRSEKIDASGAAFDEEK